MEVWSKIEGHETYSVSTYGRVRNDKSGRILKPRKNGGDLFVAIDNIQPLIHRLVAQAFIPNHENLPYVNHKDEDKKNNNVSNLEWISHKDNCNYGTRNLRIVSSPNHSSNSSKTRESISRGLLGNNCRSMPVYVDGIEFISHKQAADYIGCTINAIKNSVIRGTFKVKGHSISYAESIC